MGVCLFLQALATKSQADTSYRYVGTSVEDKTHLFWTNADNGKVVSWSPENNSLAVVVKPNERQTLKLARQLSDGDILVVRSVDVRDQIQIFSRAGQHLKTLADLPLWTILDASWDPQTDALFLHESSFGHPPRIWHTRLNTINGKQGAVENPHFKVLS